MQTNSTTRTPHANRLGLLAMMVRLLHFFPDIARAQLGRALGLSPRHVAYYLDAATILGAIGGSDALTSLGHQLAKTPPGSERERRVLRDAVACNKQLAAWVLDEGVAEHQLVDELMSAGLHATEVSAKRRASCLIAWRSYLADES